MGLRRFLNIPGFRSPVASAQADLSDFTDSAHPSTLDRCELARGGPPLAPLGRAPMRDTGTSGRTWARRRGAATKTRRGPLRPQRWRPRSRPPPRRREREGRACAPRPRGGPRRHSPCRGVRSAPVAAEAAAAAAAAAAAGTWTTLLRASHSSSFTSRASSGGWRPARRSTRPVERRPRVAAAATFLPLGMLAPRAGTMRSDLMVPPRFVGLTRPGFEPPPCIKSTAFFQARCMASAKGRMFLYSNKTVSP